MNDNDAVIFGQSLKVKTSAAMSVRPTRHLFLEFIERFVNTTHAARNTIARANSTNNRANYSLPPSSTTKTASPASSRDAVDLFTSLMFDTASSAVPTETAFNNNSALPLGPSTRSWLQSAAVGRMTEAAPSKTNNIEALPVSSYNPNNAPISADNIASFLYDANNNVDDTARTRYRQNGMHMLDRPDVVMTLLSFGGRSNNAFSNQPADSVPVNNGSLADVMFRPENFTHSFFLPNRSAANAGSNFSMTNTTTSASVLFGAEGGEIIGGAEPTAAFDATGATLITIFYAIVVAISLFGNLSVIVVHVFGERWRRSDVAAFFVNLAISDIVQALFCVPFTAHNIVNYYWYFGEIVCRLSAWIQTASVTASTYTLVCIAVDRYYLVKNPLHHRAIAGKLRWLLVIVIWLLAIATSVPLFLSMELHTTSISRRIRLSSGEVVEQTVSSDTCIEDWPEPWQEMLVTFLLVFFNFIVPLCIISVLYLAIIKKMRKKDSSDGFGAETSISGNRASSNRVTVTAITVCLMFVICWAPLHLYFLIMSTRQAMSGVSLAPAIVNNGTSLNETSPVFGDNFTANPLWLPSSPMMMATQQTENSATLLSQLMEISRQNNAYRETVEQQQSQAELKRAAARLAKNESTDLLKVFYLVAHGMAMLNHATNFLTYSYVNREFRQDFLSFFRPQQRNNSSRFNGSFSHMSMELHPTSGGWRRHSNSNCNYRDSTMTLPPTSSISIQNKTSYTRSSGSSTESKRILTPSLLGKEQRITGATFYLPSSSSLAANRHQHPLSKVSVVSTTLQTPSTEGRTSGGKRLCRIRSSPQFQLQHQRDSERPLLLRASQVEATSHIALRRMGFVPPTPANALNVYGSSIKRERFRSPKNSTVFQPTLQQAACTTNNLSGGSKNRNYSLKRKMYQLDKFDCEEPYN